MTTKRDTILFCNAPTKVRDQRTLVFVYGTLMRGYGNHWHLDRASFQGEATTRATYRMKNVGYPYIFNCDGHPGGAQVRGEVFDLKGPDEADMLKSMDRLEGVAHGHYRRVKRRVRIDGDPKDYIAWVYEPMPRTWGEVPRSRYVQPGPDGLLSWARTQSHRRVA